MSASSAAASPSASDVRDADAAEESPEARFNVRLTLLFSFFYQVSNSLWGLTLLPIYISVLANGTMNSEKTGAVGSIVAVRGIATLLAAFPAGLLSDRYGRTKTLRIAALLGAVALVWAIVAVSDDSLSQMRVACVSMGLFQAFNNAPLESIFADSVGLGRRTLLFARKHAIMQAGGVTGPLVALLMFLFLGDEWELSRVRLVLLTGLVAGLPSAAMLLFFRDVVAAPAVVDVEADELAGETAGGGAAAAGTSGDVEMAVMDKAGSGGEEEEEDLEDGEDEVKEEAASPAGWPAVSTLLVVTDTVTAVGAGMTVAFFPIFLKRSASPVGVQATYLACFVSTALLTLATQRLAARWNRVSALLLARLLGISLLVLLALAPTPLVPFLYVMRTGFMNSVRPISRSILMDHVSEAKRGMFNSFETVNRATWAGSAFVGSSLIDHGGFRLCFLVTAGLYLLATAPVALLLWYPTAVREGAGTRSEKAADSADADEPEAVDAHQVVVGGGGGGLVSRLRARKGGYQKMGAGAAMDEDDEDFGVDDEAAVVSPVDDGL